MKTTLPAVTVITCCQMQMGRVAPRRPAQNTTPRRKPTPGVASRGNSEGPTLDGRELEEVHLRVPRQNPDLWDSDKREVPQCRNGAFNLRWTKNPRKVTCLACIDITPAAEGQEAEGSATTQRI